MCICFQSYFTWVFIERLTFFLIFTEMKNCKVGKERNDLLFFFYRNNKNLILNSYGIIDLFFHAVVDMCMSKYELYLQIESCKMFHHASRNI